MLSFRESTAYGLAEAITRGLNWLTVVVLAALLPPETYGIVALMAALEAIVASVALVGQNKAILRYGAVEEGRRRALRAGVGIWVRTSLFWIPILSGLALGPKTFFSIPTWPDLVLLGLGVWLSPVREMFIACLRMERDARQYFAWRSTGAILRAALILGLTVTMRSPMGFAVGVFVSSVTLTALQWPSIRSRLGAKTGGSSIATSLVFGWPLALQTVGGFVLGFADRFMLERMIGPAEAGIYSLGYALGSSLLFVYALVALPSEPLIYASASHEPSKNESTLSKVTLLMCASGAAAALALIAVGHTLLQWGAIGQQYAAAATLVPIVLAAHLLHPIYMQGNYRLMLANRTGTLMIATVAAGILNVMLNLAMIPHFGMKGAAVATFFSMLTLNVMVWTSSLHRARVTLRELSFPSFLVAQLAVACVLCFSSNTVLTIAALAALVSLCSLGVRRIVFGRARPAATAV